VSKKEEKRDGKYLILIMSVLTLVSGIMSTFGFDWGWMVEKNEWLGGFLIGIAICLFIWFFSKIERNPFKK